MIHCKSVAATIYAEAFFTICCNDCPWVLVDWGSVEDATKAVHEHLLDAAEAESKAAR